MNMIDNVERYITFKRHLGFKFVEDARTLRAFAHEAVACSDGFIRAASVIAWARKTSTAGQARIRLRMVRGLAVWLHAEDQRHEVSLAGCPRPSAGEEILPSSPERGPGQGDHGRGVVNEKHRPAQRLHIPLHDRAACLDGIASLGRARLEADRHHPDGLVVRQSKLGKSRLVPLHESTSNALSEYLEIRMRKGGCDEHLFVLSNGKPPHHSTLSKIFLRLARQLGYRGSPGEPGTRLHDLRHGFATRSLGERSRGRSRQRQPTRPGVIHLSRSRQHGLDLLVSGSHARPAPGDRPRC